MFAERAFNIVDLRGGRMRPFLRDRLTLSPWACRGLVRKPREILMRNLASAAMFLIGHVFHVRSSQWHV